MTSARHGGRHRFFSTPRESEYGAAGFIRRHGHPGLARSLGSANNSHECGGEYWHDRRMLHYSDYLREQAEQYRALAANATDPAIKQELLELAEVCEEVANRIDDRRANCRSFWLTWPLRNHRGRCLGVSRDDAADRTRHRSARNGFRCIHHCGAAQMVRRRKIRRRET